MRGRDGIIALDRGGQMFSSAEWAKRYKQLASEGFGRLVFLIGGSWGLDPELLRMAHVRWSFGPSTLPHQLARVVLLEQLYRGIRINFPAARNRNPEVSCRTRK